MRLCSCWACVGWSEALFIKSVARLQCLSQPEAPGGILSINVVQKLSRHANHASHCAFLCHALAQQVLAPLDTSLSRYLQNQVYKPLHDLFIHKGTQRHPLQKFQFFEKFKILLPSLKLCSAHSVTLCYDKGHTLDTLAIMFVALVAA